MQLPAVLVVLLIAGGWTYSVSADACSAYTFPRTSSGPYAFCNVCAPIKAGDYDCVKELLDGGSDPNGFDDDYKSAMTLSAELGYTEISKLLLKYRAYPVDIPEPTTAIPLSQAACYGNVDIVRAFIDAGVSANMIDYDGKKASDVACTCASDQGSCPKAEILALLGESTIKVYYNYDFSSSDGVLNDGTKDITSNNRECNDLCANTSGCKVWTRIKRYVSRGGQEGECWLRSSQPTAESCRYCDSGVMSCDESDNTDIATSSSVIGSDKPRGMTDSNQDCCGLCYGSSKCKTWTRIKTDTEYNKKGECWLREGLPQTIDREETASGQVKIKDILI